MPKSSDYFCKVIPGNPKAITVAKFVDGDYVDNYVVESANCQCYGATFHRTQCRHMKIKLLWDSLQRPQGYFTVDKAGNPHFHSTEVTENGKEESKDQGGQEKAVQKSGNEEGLEKA